MNMSKAMSNEHVTTPPGPRKHLRVNSAQERHRISSHLDVTHPFRTQAVIHSFYPSIIVDISHGLWLIDRIRK